MSSHDARVESLLATLDDLAGFLRAHDETGWADWVAQDAAWIRAGDLHGVRHFLRALGGQGSLSDVLFNPGNGNAVDMEEADRLNAEFDSLTTRGYDLAKALAREADARP